MFVLFNGGGHVHEGKVRRGAGILILRWFVYRFLFVLLIHSFATILMQFYNPIKNSNDSGVLGHPQPNSMGNYFHLDTIISEVMALALDQFVQCIAYTHTDDNSSGLC